MLVVRGSMTEDDAVPAAPKAKPKRGEVRQALLDAGLESLTRLTAADVVAGIGLRELARRAGVSSASFYHHFATMDDYARALLEHVYDPARVGASRQVNSGLDNILDAALPVEQGYALHASELARLTSDPEFRVRVGFWALGGPEADRPYRDFLAAVDDLIADGMLALFDHWGREIRVPFDTRSVLAIHVALVQGAAVRHLLDPERLSMETFKRVASALTFIQLRLIGDPHSIDDRLAEINYYPLKASRVAAKPNSATRARLLDAAAGLFGLHGFERTSVAQIARRAGTAADTVYAHFGSKSRIAVELFLTHAADAPFDSSAGDPGERLLGHLRKVADFAATRPDTAPHYREALLAGDLPADLPDPIMGQAVGLVGELQASGRIRSGCDTVDLAGNLIAATLRRIANHPSGGADGAVAYAWSVLMEGALGRATSAAVVPTGDAGVGVGP